MKNARKVIGFNCPPKSGKDTIALEIAQLLHEQHGAACSIQSLAAPMREVMMSFVGLKSFKEYNEQKDNPNPLFTLAWPGDTNPIQQSGRDFMISLSESFIKPVYGHDFWVRHLIHRMPEWSGLCLIPDFGFKVETDYLVDFVGADNFCMVRLYRDGTDFSIDSRGYVDCPNILHIDNNKTPRHAAEAIIDHLVHTRKWTLLADAK